MCSFVGKIQRLLNSRYSDSWNVIIFDSVVLSNELLYKQYVCLYIKFSITIWMITMANYHRKQHVGSKMVHGMKWSLFLIFSLKIFFWFKNKEKFGSHLSSVYWSEVMSLILKFKFYHFGFPTYIFIFILHSSSLEHTVLFILMILFTFSIVWRLGQVSTY